MCHNAQRLCCDSAAAAAVALCAFATCFVGVSSVEGECL